MSYNGWKNYSTWNINLWIMNEEPLYRQWQEYKRIRRSFSSVSAYATARDLFPSGKTPDDVEIGDPEIDWQEIANAWNED